MGSVTAASKFDETKNAILDKMSDSVRNVLSDHDEESEYVDLMQYFKQIVLLSIVLQLGAVGVAIATATSALSAVPGVAGTTVLAASGVVFLSQGTKRVTTQYEEMWEDRQSHLDEILATLSSREVGKMGQKILASVVPYTRYVETEEERISVTIEECETVHATAQALRNRISKLYQ